MIMYKHILVPLDGSELAEAALPAAGYLARVLQAAVTLVHIVESDAPSTVHGERHLRSREEAEAYLREVSQRWVFTGQRIEWHVHTEAAADVALTMAAHEDELGPDLIVMCTHGRGGVRRILMGSMAQRIVAAGKIPVLLVRPDGPRAGDAFAIRSVLVPLDGEPAHEGGYRVGLELARLTGAVVQLLSVVPTMGTLAGRDATMGRFMPGTTQAILEYAEQNLKYYLQQQAARARVAGVESTMELRHGEPAPSITEAAEALDSTIIVLATHGRAGTEAFWNHSVCAAVHAQTKRPLLLVPAL
jgi:nucleotide-binding universal stress UspA family protein